ncbi:tetratricopeptide repeat protein [Streptomyces sp. NPDC002586]
MHSPDLYPVLARSGYSLGETGQVTAARDHFQALTETVRDHLGPDHRYTLSCRGNLAWWRGMAGDKAGAVEAHTELLNDLVRVLV